MNRPVDPKNLAALNKVMRKAKEKKKESPPPKKESSGDENFDEAIELFLRSKKDK